MPRADKQSNCNFIDLFAGAGGLSEGFLQAGFRPIAHVEMDKYAAKTLETRSAYYYLRNTGNLALYKKYLSKEINRNEFMRQIPASVTKTVINQTLSDETLPSVFKTIDSVIKMRGINNIDVIVGGPPCQAYSIVGRAQSSHMGTPMEDDPRNYLYKLYARFLKKYQPRMFVFENVTGIESAQGGTIWKNLQKYLKRVGYEIECREQNAQNFGVLQNRRRMIIVGWLKNSGLAYPDFVGKKSDAVVNDLFTDLPKLHPGESNNNYSKKMPSRYVTETGIRTKDDILTLQNCRPNIERDVRIYKKVIELWNDGHKRLNYNDLPEELKTHKNRHSFIDRFKIVEGDEHFCHTILAHLSKDGHYFIHPDINQHRSITVREAARIQSFPDSYYFEGPRTSQFVQIGNAVPPLMARGIAEGIFTQLQGEDTNGQQ
ncbi:DNA cytosine methyltransferase [Bifidobacterium sp. W8101]|uniref:DNA cytosine methyltransferase n=1 Tax=Bifidobacterium TaxID=1678 RepID=UPI0018DC6F73|nr:MULTISPECIES: DNA cytosine methyltransferase [Bifidobacterium]MBI0126291.1 DNA cytosine methyltransferase [Bifidobacterium choladohabitans]MBI0127860.1 DNA cytosine methyltransferase [Bifidobacterium sp. W8103]MBI0138448.1 DNA cytosine methyltransferase [Bifidobacterium sp. W8105]MBI0148582.1 DNA cytosine methyltransferase [Bifidobacterium sp. W8107]